MMFVSRSPKQRLQTPTSSYFIDELMNIPKMVNMAPIVPIVAPKNFHPSLYTYSLIDESCVKNRSLMDDSSFVNRWSIDDSSFVNRSSTRSARFRTSPLVAGSCELSLRSLLDMVRLLHNARLVCQVLDLGARITP